MENYSVDINKFDELLSKAKSVLIVQADNPDADSLGSSVALEQLLMLQNKDTLLYSAVPMPSYLRYVTGWDRVSNILMEKFDLTIFVDVSTTTLIKKLILLNHLEKIQRKPIIVIDHHDTVNQKMDIADLSIVLGQKSSTGQIIYEIAKANKYEFNQLFLESILISILGDTQGLSNQLVTPDTYRLVAEIIELGASRFNIDDRRKEYSSYPVEVYKYKASLINRTEFYNDNEIAILTLNQDDITTFGPLYNQGPLMHPEILNIKGIKLSIVIKVYSDGHMTGSIRSNNRYPISAKLSDYFDGGGHDYASGFNISSKMNPSELKKQIVLKASELLENI